MSTSTVNDWDKDVRGCKLPESASKRRFPAPKKLLSDSATDHRSLRFADGRVLVVGGVIDNWGVRSKLSEVPAEIWDPANQPWQVVPELKFKREQEDQQISGSGQWLRTPPEEKPQPRLMRNGRVMLAEYAGVDREGVHGFWVMTWEPGTRTASSRNRVSAPLPEGSLGLLPSGDLLFVGGLESDGKLSRDVHVWSAIEGAWRRVGRLNQVVQSPRIVIVDGESVLIADASGGSDHAQMLNWTSGSVRGLRLPSKAGGKRFSAVTLAKGRVLLTSEVGSYVSDPDLSGWTPLGQSNQLRLSDPILVGGDGSAIAFVGTRPGAENLQGEDEFRVLRLDTARREWRVEHPPKRPPISLAGQSGSRCNAKTQSESPSY